MDVAAAARLIGAPAGHERGGAVVPAAHLFAVPEERRAVRGLQDVLYRDGGFEHARPRFRVHSLQVDLQAGAGVHQVVDQAAVLRGALETIAELPGRKRR